jgi:hypothetical protein
MRREFTVAGGLLSYGPSLATAYQQAGAKAAKALGLAVPPSILGLADEVIE